MPTADAAAVRSAVEDAHRREWAFVLAATVRVTRDLDDAEEAVQSAYLKAIETWQRDGIPASPGAWLTTTSRRLALNVLRRRATLQRKIPLLLEDEPEVSSEPRPDGEFPDDRLRLVFIGCHPALSIEARVALTLRLVCGATTPEIAHAFLTSESTMAARITRAKRKIAAAGIPYAVPRPDAYLERLDSVLTVAHLLYSLGHVATSGEQLVRRELAARALDLTRMLRVLLPGEPEVMGVLAHLLATEARRATRTRDDGSLVRLEDQDRSRWDRALIEEADELVLASLRLRPRPGRFTLQAAIASVHAQGVSYAETDWPQLLFLYDRLMEVAPTPVVELNRAVVVAELRGASAALDIVDAIAASGRLDRYRYLHATRADLLLRVGRPEDAAEAFRAALALTDNAVEQAFLIERIERASSAGATPRAGMPLRWHS